MPLCICELPLRGVPQVFTAPLEYVHIVLTLMRVSTGCFQGSFRTSPQYSTNHSSPFLHHPNKAFH
jgi:hypothetical protein